MIKTEYKPISFLKAHTRNPRKIEDKDFAVLKESIKANPDYFEVRPILCKPDGTVFAGNMRLRAAVALGMEQVPVAIMDIPDARVRELMIRDNIQNGQWDADILGADFEIGELQLWGYDLDAFGEKNLGSTNGSGSGINEDQRWIYTCGECGTEHIFTKRDLKPYEGS